MSSTNLLPASLQNSLQEVVKLCNQSGAMLRAITLSTTEGVPLGRVYGSGSFGSDDDDAANNDYSNHWNEETLMLMETVWAPPSKHLPILFGNNNNNNKDSNSTNNTTNNKPLTMTALYDHGSLMHVYLAPIVVTVLCAKDGNLGALRSTGIPLLQEILAPLRATLVESLKGGAEDVEDGVVVVEDGAVAADYVQ